MHHYYNPVEVYQGAGVLEKLPQVLHNLCVASQGEVLLIAWSEQVLHDRVINALIAGEHGLKVHPLIFSVSNPSVQDLLALYEQSVNLNIAAIVGIGGGSVLDVAKSLCCIHGPKLNNVDELRTAIASKSFAAQFLPWVGIPTTAGTGSEVTCWATIWDPELNVKRSVESPLNYAKVALVDTNLSATLPLPLAVSSALDAAAHAIESYWARGSNFVSRGLALEAIATIMENIDGLFAHDFNAHDAMARGSLLAGLSFSNTKTTACHSLSYPLTMHYHIPHGAAVSLLLAPVLNINLKAIPEPQPLLQALRVKDAAELQARINSLLERAQIKPRLSLWGAKEEDLAAIAPQCITKGRADNNPVDLDIATITQILHTIY